MRGDLYRINAPKNAVGHEQQGARYAVVLQSDDLLLSTVIVAPTSTLPQPAIFHPAIEMTDRTRTHVLIEQLQAVDSERRLGEFAGRLSPEEMSEVDSKLRMVMGLLR